MRRVVSAEEEELLEEELELDELEELPFAQREMAYPE
jgi:hypothetical protein